MGKTPYRSRVCLPVLQQQPWKVGVLKIATGSAEIFNTPQDFMNLTAIFCGAATFGVERKCMGADDMLFIPHGIWQEFA